MSANGETQPAENRVAIARAAQAVIWGMPAVNADLMLQAAIKASAKGKVR